MSTAKLSSAIAALGLAALALAGCTATTAPQAAGSSPAPTVAAKPETKATPTPQPTEQARCYGLSEVYGDGEGLYWERRGTLKDLGEREFARGTVTLGEDGTPATYTVEPGDVMTVVAERLCAYPTLDSMNHRRDIHPGQVLWLTPDPELPWIPYYSPWDAPEGFRQIPYQQAIERAGAAVDAGDVDAVRAIWDDTLKPMFSNQATIDAVQKVVDAGHLDELRQLFS